MRNDLILEHIRDKKLRQLYQALTRTDFNGNYEDDYVLSVLYAMRCIDVCQSQKAVCKERDYVDLAKEIIRISDVSEENDFEEISIMSWTRALFDYMKENGKAYRDIHRMNSYDLVKGVYEFVG
ncbi:MAG: hypothetical protein K5648_09360 [Erysipelotrichaceae bacterium]|nr:hypothetical protein [Erysipelotrichaceae bacterium]